jgi:hypothetical protein
MKNMIFNCLLVDDENMALDLLENYLLRINGFKIVDKINHPRKAIELLSSNTIDLLFLDIHMPQINGLSLLENLTVQPKVIFTTAHSHYAPAAFELDAIDYLMKPYSFERFEKAIAKFKRIQSLIPEKKEAYLQIKKEGTWFNIKQSQIIYIEGLKEYVRIHCHDNEQHVVLMSMTFLEETLPSSEFIRIHKSYIVSVSAIIGFNRDEVVTTNQIKLPVSRLKKDIIVAQLKIEK